VLLVIRHDRSEILHFIVTARPTARWVIQQLRDACPFDTRFTSLAFPSHT